MFQDTIPGIEPQKGLEPDDFRQDTKVSDLIRKAVNHYDTLDSNKFVFKSDEYFRVEGDVCEVCLAGSLLSRLENNKTELINSNGIFNFDVYPYLSSHKMLKSVSKDWGKYKITKSLVKKVMVLEHVRRGELPEAIVINSYSEDEEEYNEDKFREQCMSLYNGYTEFFNVANMQLTITWSDKNDWHKWAREMFLRHASMVEAAGY